MWDVMGGHGVYGGMTISRYFLAYRDPQKAIQLFSKML